MSCHIHLLWRHGQTLRPIAWHNCASFQAQRGQIKERLGLSCPRKILADSAVRRLQQREQVRAVPMQAIKKHLPGPNAEFLYVRMKMVTKGASPERQCQCQDWLEEPKQGDINSGDGLMVL